MIGEVTMKIIYSDFSNFVDRIVAIDSARDKSRPQKNVAFEVVEQNDNNLALVVSFGDATNNIHQVVPLQDYLDKDETDENGIVTSVRDFGKNQKITISLDRLKEIANLFKPTGKTKTSSIEILKEVINGEEIPNSLIFKCEKYIEVESGTENDQDNQESKKIEVIGSFEQAIRWDDAGASIKNAIYQRISINDIICEDDAEYDAWKVSDLKELITKLSADNNRLTLLSSVRSIGYVSNVSYSILMKTKDFDFKNTLVLSSAVDSQLCAILNKLKGDTIIYLTAIEEQSIFKAYTEDKSIAMSFSTAKADQNYVLGMNKITSMDFKGIQCTMYTDAVKDIVNNLASILSSKGDNTVNTEIIVNENNSFIMFDNVKSQTGSHKNNFRVNVQSIRRQDETLGNVKIKLPVNSVQKILSNIRTDYVTFDIEFTDENRDNMTLRIAEISVDSQKCEIEKAINEYKENNSDLGDDLNISEILTNDKLMEIRKDAIGLAGFISVKSK